MIRKMELNVGDKVKVRTWEDMEQEFGLDFDGDICMGTIVFVKKMKELCGRIVTISEVKHADFPTNFFRVEEDGHMYWWSSQMFENIAEEHITSMATFLKGKGKLYDRGIR